MKDLWAHFLHYLWGEIKARTNSAILTPPKPRGIGFPDSVRYHAAVHLMRLVDWCAQKDVKMWIELEQAAVPVPLEGLVLGKSHSHPNWTDTVPPPHKFHWKALFWENLIPTPTGQILSHPLISSTIKSILTVTSLSCTPACFCQFLALLYSNTMNTMKKTCNEAVPIRHTILQSCSMLVNGERQWDPSFLIKWEQDLCITFSLAQKDRILIFAHKASLANVYQENRYKILIRWYRMPQIKFEVLTWSLNSPDLNPIKSLWDMLEKLV